MTERRKSLISQVVAVVAVVLPGEGRTKRRTRGENTRKRGGKDSTGFHKSLSPGCRSLSSSLM